jgi:hypothetical protein
MSDHELRLGINLFLIAKPPSIRFNSKPPCEIIIIAAFADFNFVIVEINLYCCVTKL